MKYISGRKFVYQSAIPLNRQIPHPRTTRFIVELNFKSKFLCPSNDNYKQKILKEFSSTSSMAFLSGMTKHGSYCKKLVFVGTNY